jgi:ethanolamine utilization protein EutN
MFLGRVVGCVWSTAKHKDLEGHRLLVVERLTPEMKATGVRTVCTDVTGAGAGEMVYYCRSRESSFPFLPKEVPTDATIVAIVDSIHVERS